MTQLESLEFQEKKELIAKIVEAAKKSQFITDADDKNLMEKLDSDILTIGIIGQMKCGKSTFLNAFVFGDDVLPVATTPMTASLTIITYGEEQKIVAHFYDEDEWEFQKNLSSSEISESLSDEKKSQIKAAQELVAKSARLGTSLPQLLGKEKTDELENLKEYVGENGKYVAITKYVTIYHPAEYLKGIHIVDTPGFNDPIISREQRTKEFLKEADAVVLLLYAGHPFDATDEKILFNYIRENGTGKVIVGINKYDIPFTSQSAETREEITNYVKEQIKKVGKRYDADDLLEMIKEKDFVAFSSAMALLSALPQSKISENEKHKADWERFKEGFEISTQKEFFEESYIQELTDSIKIILEKEKYDILFKKPVSQIKGTVQNKIETLKKDIVLSKDKIKSLSLPDDELEERQEKLERFTRRMKRKVDVLGAEIKDKIEVKSKLCKQGLEDSLGAFINKAKKNIDSGKFKKEVASVIGDYGDWVIREMLRKYSDLLDEIKLETKRLLENFIRESNEFTDEFLSDEDEDIKLLIKEIIQNIPVELENERELKEKLTKNFREILGAKYDSFFDKDKKIEAQKRLDEIRIKFDPTEDLDKITQLKDSIIETAKTKLFAEFLEPMTSQLEDIRTKCNEKDNELKKTEEKLKGQEEEMKKMEKSAQEIFALIEAAH